MHYRLSVISAAAGLACLVAESALADPALYSSTTTAPSSLFTINGQPNPSSNPAESGGEGNGDDFNTGYRVINVTGFSFYGGQTDANQSNYAVSLSFYTTTGLRISSINVSASDTYGIGWHTINPSDFYQNGSNYLQVTGAGYVVFQPYYFSIVNANTNATYNAPTGTPQLQLGFGGVPTLGANNPTLSALTVTPGPGVLSTGAFATSAGPTGQYAQFEIDGTVASSANTTTPLWAAPGSGNWSDSTKWTQGAPNATTATANFFQGITSNSTVTLVSAETVGTLNFDNPVYNYTLAGSSSLTLSSNTGAATLNSWGGSQKISCPVIYSGGLNVTTFADPSSTSPGPTAPSLTLPLSITASGNLTKSGAGTLAFAPSTTGITTLSLPAINISSGTVALQSSGTNSTRTLLVTPSFTLSGGLLDLGANDALLSSAGASGLSTAFSEIQQGYGSGNWNGSAGITSSVAAANTSHLTALGIALNSGSISSFDGNSTSAGDVLIKYTYYGDANLDGKVDGTDYSRIDAAYLADKTSPGTMTGWYNGDFNYDGVIDGSDYTLIDNAFNSQGSQITALFSSPQAVITSQIAPSIATSPVPEPKAFALVGAASLGLLSRRRRSRSPRLNRQVLSTFKPERTGFTLVELLVVIGIIALLISILLPALSKARESAAQQVCASNLHQLAVAAFSYAADNNGFCVPSASYGIKGMDTLNGMTGTATLNWDYEQVYSLGVSTFSFERGYLGHYLKTDKVIQCPAADQYNLPVTNVPETYGICLLGAKKISRLTLSTDTAIFADAIIYSSAGLSRPAELMPCQAPPATAPLDCFQGRHTKKGIGNIGFYDGHVAAVVVQIRPANTYSPALSASTTQAVQHLHIGPLYNKPIDFSQNPDAGTYAGNCYNIYNYLFWVNKQAHTLN
jgi:prepilin-type N-terminal cleavage/methylation domain-containing protein/prepilin-type processing-associated H-X9-DG protein